MPSVPRATELMALLGLTESHRGYVEPYAATCIFTEGNQGSSIEFVVPHEGRLAKFNRGAGGLHHLAISVDSLDAVGQDLARRGISLLESAPVRGAGDFVCNFLSPGYTGGIIVEFVETTRTLGGRPGASATAIDQDDPELLRETARRVDAVLRSGRGERVPELALAGFSARDEEGRLR